MGCALGQLNNVQFALQCLTISWFFTNSLDIFWVMYYPQSSNDITDGEYYLASSQFTTIQNLTDFIVDLNFFILPRMGFLDGIKELLDWYFYEVCTIFGGLRYFESLPRTGTVMRSNKMLLATESLSEEIPAGLELNEPLIQSTSCFDYLSQCPSDVSSMS
jgi:hypothetical protein